jgi:predicted deacylase
MPLNIAESAGQRHWSGMVEPEAGVQLPCTIIRGRSPGPKLLVTAGVHGAEYSSIEAARRLCQTAPDDVVGELTILPIISIEAFFKHLAFIHPADNKNLNRVFPGKADGTPAERRAAWLTSVMKGMDGYIDLHCGDMTETLIPFSVLPKDDAKSAEMALASGLPYAVKSAATGHSYDAALGVGVPGLILESGNNGLWTEDSVGLLVTGVRRIMAHLGMLSNSAAAPAPVAETPVLCSMAGAAAPAAGYWHPAIKLGDKVKPGDLLGTMYDLAGKWERKITSEREGMILYYSTSLAISQGEALVGIRV